MCKAKPLICYTVLYEAHQSSKLCDKMLETRMPSYLKWWDWGEVGMWRMWNSPTLKAVGVLKGRKFFMLSWSLRRGREICMESWLFLFNPKRIKIFLPQDFPCCFIFPCFGPKSLVKVEVWVMLSLLTVKTRFNYKPPPFSIQIVIQHIHFPGSHASFIHRYQLHYISNLRLHK